MTYNSGIPASGQSLGASRPGVQTNFQLLQTTIDRNHVDMNQSDAGKHNLIEFLSQAADPTTAANVIAEYTKEVSGNPQLFMRRAGNGQVIQMSVNSPVVVLTNPIPNITFAGSTFLPGGLILKYVNVVVPSNPYTIIFATIGIAAFPNNLFTANVTINQSNQNRTATVNAGNSTQIDIQTNSVGDTHFLTLIGN